MKMRLATSVMMAALVSAGIGGAGRADPPPPTVIPAPNNPAGYQPVPAQKPLPPEGYIPGQPLPQPGQAQAQGPSVEEAFVQAYVNRRSPRMMVFVNRTIHGDPLPKDGLEELIRVEEKQSATGAVNVSSNKSDNSNSQATSSGYTGASASVSNSNSNNSSSFVSGGPAEYSHTTSVKKAPEPYDSIGASPEDYEMIEASLVKYFDESGRVQIQDSDAARGKLDREKVLRLENGDPAAARLLSTELQQDVLIRVTAQPTRHASWGNAVRIIAKAVGTTDARNLGTAFVDMPLPMTKTNINAFTGYLARDLMGQMATKWGTAPEFDPVEIRIYKTAGVDDALRIKKWLQATKGVQSVTTRGATGGDKTSYAAFAVAYAGAPEDLYADLKDAIGASQGLKAIDVQNNTIDLEVTGQLNLVTTTRRSETITTTTTTEEKKVEPINPAPPQ